MLNPGLLAQQIMFRVYENVPDEAMIFGRDMFSGLVIEYTRDRIRLLKKKPDDYDVSIPIIQKGSSFYVELSVNGQNNTYYLDTGFCDLLALPVRDMEYAKSCPMKMQTEYADVETAKTVTEYIERKAEMNMGPLDKKVTVVYHSHLYRDYWFNPVCLLYDFVMDIKKGYLSFKSSEIGSSPLPV